ncbi:MAG: hypothetical protein BWY46_01956 [Firmicutes bacterium ADurb.Bin300]|nr:MAG: hypothetical protein BWY46_01956 [Firmicutes bacterium ADurb.Bin300]
MGNYVSFPLSAVCDGVTHIRASSSKAEAESIELHSIRGVYTKPDDVPSFKLSEITAFAITESGIETKTIYNNITEIWGIK